jgi:aminoglycoside phosphotransferase/RimJ/RimL family protein N-acetyltransferase
MLSTTHRMRLMTKEEARVITGWRYEAPYSFYNMEEDPETIQELLNGSYFSVIGQEEELVGYFCYGKNAQVPGGHQQGLYTGEKVLDIGLGLRPDLTGKGMGLDFLDIGLNFAQMNYTVSAFRLSVATFNMRAIAVYENVGFKKVDTFMSKVRDEEVQFMLMTLKSSVQQILRDNLPLNLAKQISSYKWEEIMIGCSGSYVFRLYNESVCNNKQENMYLKIIEKEKTESLIPEKERLDWLKDKLPVPQFLYFSEDLEHEFMLISELPGLISCHSSFTDNLPEILTQIAFGLRLIHAVPIVHCPFNQSLDCKIKNAERRVQLGLVDEDDFDEKRQGRKSEELLTELKANRPTSEELVFTHGDYCLPNIIIEQGKISGFIDWGRAGVADKYQDLALAARSIAYNFGREYVNTFFEAYGIEEIDQEKVEYFQLLDEFY